MSGADLETIPDHIFKVREKVFVLDVNGHDVWEGTIKSIDGNEITVYDPDYPKNSDEKISDMNRIFPSTKTNVRIFREQEMKRSELAPPEDDGSDFKEADDDDDDDSEVSDKEEDFTPDDDDFGGTKKKSKKPKKPKKAEPKYHPRPAGARSNPPRGKK